MSPQQANRFLTSLRDETVPAELVSLVGAPIRKFAVVTP
jgi:hypothetical protein